MRKHLTYANVMATMAFLIAVAGGTAYAANTIGTSDIINGQVRSVDIGNNQVQSVDVRNDSLPGGGLTGADILESSLGTVQAATEADYAGVAGEVTSEAWHELLPATPNPACAQGHFCADGSGGCPWQNIGGPWDTGAYFRDPSGIVHLKGEVYVPSPCPNGEILLLPDGYRPELAEAFPSISPNLGGVGTIVIDSLGRVTANADASSFSGGLSLAGITFPCGPSGQNGCR